MIIREIPKELLSDSKKNLQKADKCLVECSRQPKHKVRSVLCVCVHVLEVGPEDGPSRGFPRLNLQKNFVLKDDGEVFEFYVMSVRWCCYYTLSQSG